MAREFARRVLGVEPADERHVRMLARFQDDGVEPSVGRDRHVRFQVRFQGFDDQDGGFLGRRARAGRGDRPAGRIRLVGEVVGRAVYYNPVSYVREPTWKLAITGTTVVKMQDLVNFVQNKDATFASPGR